MLANDSPIITKFLLAKGAKVNPNELKKRIEFVNKMEAKGFPKKKEKAVIELLREYS